MIIDLRTLKKSGKDQESFYFEYETERELLNVPSANILMPIKVNGTVCITGEHSAYVEGEITFTVKGDCTRCLKTSEREYLFDFAEEVFPDNEDGYSLINDKVDLSSIIDDTVMTNFPLTFLCSEDCKGLCSGCGVNLNDEKCKCEK